MKRASKRIREWRRRHAYARCACRLPQCWGEATEPHHRLARSVGGGDEDANLVPVCRACHVRYHEVCGQHRPTQAQRECWLKIGPELMLPEVKDD